MASPQTTQPNVLISWQDNETVCQQRRGNLSRMFAAASNKPSSSHGRPKTAADLAASLVNLVFPYDVRIMQRNLARLQNRMKAVEAKVHEDEGARIRVEQGLKMVESEMSTFQSLHDKAPLGRQSNNVADLDAKIREIGAEMIKKAAANENNISQALQMMQSILSELKDKHAQMQRGETASPGQKETTATATILNSNEALTGGEAKVDEEPTQQENRDQPAKPKDTSPGDTEESPLGQTRILRQTKAREAQQKKVEDTATLKKETANEISPPISKPVPARRLAFTAYTKQTERRFRVQKPQRKRSHKEFLWDYIDNMEDKDMSALVQQMMCEQFPEDVTKSRGRGKAGRQININGNVEWPQLLDAIKCMPIPECLQEDG